MSSLLAIDTASDSIAVAYEAPDGSLSVETDARPREHSTSLLRLIESVAGGRDTPLDSIVVVRGPGGYAGVRVGIATAQGLSLARGIPVAGVDTLRAIAEAAWLGGQRTALISIHPAGRGDFSAQRFATGGEAGAVELLQPALAIEGLVVGEGAGELGGRDLWGDERVLGALAAFRQGLVAPAEALYVREPHITLARKSMTPAGNGHGG